MQFEMKYEMKYEIILMLALLVSLPVSGTYMDMDSLPSANTGLELKQYNPKNPTGCYFRAAYQGEFKMQLSSNPNAGDSTNALPDGEPVVQYSSINVTYNSIPVWGYCHKKVGESVLLIERRGEFRECFRCIRLVQRARNIIEIFSEALNSCYTNESLAKDSCAALNSTAILYRTQEVGDIEIRHEYCPIVSRYRFKYMMDGIEECSLYSSDLGNCPKGAALHMNFKRCAFPDYEAYFQCLGSWPVSEGSTARYIALVDSRGMPNTKEFVNQTRPYYRCGIYDVDNQGKTYLSLSSDSSCTRNLNNASSGYETFVLTKSPSSKQMPPYVRDHLRTFPKWAQGEWQETLIVNGTMTYTDSNGFSSYTFVAVDADEKAGRYIVYSKNQCEEEAYVCLMMRQRSENILEFVVGTESTLDYQPTLCDELAQKVDKYDIEWLILARVERLNESPCPITGEYTGTITDLMGTCAELSSNCNTRQIMYYKVYDCETAEVYEERTYLCLGQWGENGVVYTYTLRNETQTNECFVGAIVSDDEMYIKEAGDYCVRANNDPKILGMRLYKKGHCYGNSPSPAPTIPPLTIPHDPIMRIASTPKIPAAPTPTAKYNTFTVKNKAVTYTSTVTAVTDIPRHPSFSASTWHRSTLVTTTASLSTIFVFHRLIFHTRLRLYG